MSSKQLQTMQEKFCGNSITDLRKVRPNSRHAGEWLEHLRSVPIADLLPRKDRVGSGNRGGAKAAIEQAVVERSIIAEPWNLRRLVSS